MPLPEQQYFTLPELADRWSTTERRILELILNHELWAVALATVNAATNWADDDGNFDLNPATKKVEVRTWFDPDLLFSLFIEDEGQITWFIHGGREYRVNPPVTITPRDLLITCAELDRFESDHEIAPPGNAITTASPEPVPEDMDLLQSAWRLFWRNASQRDRTTWPLRNEVKRWLTEKGMSGRLADAGATIISPDWARKGGRR